MEEQAVEQAPLQREHARVPEHVVYHDFETETIVLNLETGEYHGLNPAGGRILAGLAATSEVRVLADALAAEYGRDPAEVAADVDAFCRDLLARGLIEVSMPGDG